MVEQDERWDASCESCGKRYRVPDPDRTYSCKACGGSVVASADSEESAAGGSTDRELAADRRHEANDALKRGYAWIGAVTWFYRLGALSYAVATGLAVLALARLDVPREQGLLVVALTSLMSAVMLIGAMVILFRPFAWTLAIAILATAVSVVHALGPNPFGMAALGSAAWAALAWAALVPTYRFHQLIEQHKDMYILHHASAKTRRSVKDRSAEERHARLVGAMNRAAGRAWRASTAAAALLCVAAGFGAYGVIATLRPSRLSDAVARFEAEWSSGEAEGVIQLLPESVRAVKGERFAGLAAGHWNAELPPLPAAALERDGNFARAEYDVAGVPVEAEWRLSDLEWILTGLELPVPPLEPRVDALLAAWSSSDIDALVALFSDDAKERMHDSIQVAARERGWETFPPIQETAIGDYSRGDATVVLNLERGEVETLWHMRNDGDWRMHGLKLPRRRKAR